MRVPTSAGFAGFAWERVGELLRNWHGIETTPELHRGLVICESELLNIDEGMRKRRERERKSKMRSRRR